MLYEDADDYSVSRSLEAYLLWLFGAMMFSNTHGDSVDKVLMIRTDAQTMMQAYGMYTQYAESQGSSQASSSFPCSTAQGPPPIPPYNTGNGSNLHIT